MFQSKKGPVPQSPLGSSHLLGQLGSHAHITELSQRLDRCVRLNTSGSPDPSVTVDRAFLSQKIKQLEQKWGSEDAVVNLVGCFAESQLEQARWGMQQDAAREIDTRTRDLQQMFRLPVQELQRAPFEDGLGTAGSSSAGVNEESSRMAGPPLAQLGHGLRQQSAAWKVFGPRGPKGPGPHLEAPEVEDTSSFVSDSSTESTVECHLTHSLIFSVVASVLVALPARCQCLGAQGLFRRREGHVSGQVGQVETVEVRHDTFRAMQCFQRFCSAMRRGRLRTANLEVEDQVAIIFALQNFAFEFSECRLCWFRCEALPPFGQLAQAVRSGIASQISQLSIDIVEELRKRSSLW
eukprot:Skav231333  [mRNA]  locus=scaffold819:115261:126940:- [translate_table: standard]